MDKDWRKGYLTAVNNDGNRTTWETMGFIAVQPEPYHVHSITGMRFYLALEEARYRKHHPDFHRIYSVGVASNGSQGGECSLYTAIITGEEFPPALERFDQFHRFAVSHYKKLCPQFAEV